MSVKSENSKLNFFYKLLVSVEYGNGGKSFLILSEGRRFPVTEGIENLSVLSFISILLISYNDLGITRVHKFISVYSFCLLGIVVSG